MPRVGKVAVIGLKQTLKDLETVEYINVRNATLMAGAKVVRAEAQRLAPKKSGALRASIYAATADESEYPTAAATAAALSDGGKLLAPSVARRGSAIVGVAMEYGVVIEFSRKRGKPFLRKALDNSQQAIVEAMDAELKRRVKGLT